MAAKRSRKPKESPPKEKIRFHELVAKIQRGDISEDDIRLWFVPDYVGEKPFSPGVKINEATVDVSGVEQAAWAIGTALGDDAMRMIRSRKSMRGLETATIASSAVLIAEGDSWFNLPSFFYPPTAIDFLAKSFGIRNLAKYGDELRDMITTGEYVRPLADGGIRHFLFSGGGNDVLGDLARHLRQRASTDHDPANASRYIKPSFSAVLDQISDLFAGLARQVRSLSPETIIYVHGYDYAIPDRFGNWLGKALVFRGFDPVKEKPLADAIIRLMVDAHNQRLKALAAAHANFVHVDLSGLLKPEDWFGDEIHPGKSGATKIANVFKAEMAKRALVG